MVQDGISELTLERYRAAVRVQYGAGDYRTPFAARLAMVKAVGTDKLRGHESEWQQFWRLEEDKILQSVPKVLTP